ncbi:MAG: NAD(+) synthase [Candidatus Hermodarchaeia archaeon]|jgi:NAD+ synthase
MSIVDLSRTRDHIVSWLRDYAKKAGTKTWIVGLSGGIDSALTALLCKRTNMPTVCVAMPCHSSGFSLERARSFAKEFDLDLVNVDLTGNYDSIMKQIGEGEIRSIKAGEENPIATGGLRSCLRAPVLSYMALATRGLIVGTGNRSEDNLIRYFQKFGDGCVDLCPIADIFKSEVYELFAYMTGLVVSHTDLASAIPEVSDRAINDETVTGPESARAIYEATPTADLWGAEGGQTDEEELGISYDEVEWADRQDMQNGIITSEEDPARHRAWVGYTIRQREVIAKVHQMEKISRHKYNPNLPVCDVRGVSGLVK